MRKVSGGGGCGSDASMSVLIDVASDLSIRGGCRNCTMSGDGGCCSDASMSALIHVASDHCIRGSCRNCIGTVRAVLETVLETVENYIRNR